MGHLAAPTGRSAQVGYSSDALEEVVLFIEVEELSTEGQSRRAGLIRLADQKVGFI